MWRRRLSVRWVAAAIAVALVGALGVSASAFARGSAAKCGSLTMDENAWAGATANVYVLKYVLEKNLGCTVNIAKLPESTPLFQAMVRRQGRRGAGGLEQHPPQGQPEVRHEREGLEPRLERRHRPHRLVHPDVPDAEVPAVQDLAGA